MRKKPNYKEVCDALETNTFRQWPKEIQEKALTLEKNSYTILQFAADNGFLNRIPPKLLTEENLLGKGGRKPSSYIPPIHIAAKHGFLDQIPQHLLNERTLFEADDNDETPFRIAAMFGHLNQIPEKFLTEEHLTQEHPSWVTVLHLAINHGCLHQLPPRTFSYKTLKDLIETFSCLENDLKYLKKEIRAKELGLKNIKKITHLHSKSQPTQSNP